MEPEEYLVEAEPMMAKLNLKTISTCLKGLATFGKISISYIAYQESFFYVVGVVSP